MSETQTIYVDDTDPGITYNGDWISDKGSLDSMGNYGPPYMSTSHYITGTGSFSYTFSGTYVGIFGSSVDGSNPTRQCTVDGVAIPNNVLTAAVNGQMQCQVDGLPDAKHTIVVTVSSANPKGYWFDSISYIPSASVSRANAVLSIENGDPSMNYGVGWSQNGPGFITTTNGATFSLQFTGRTLTWLGYYLSGNPFASTTASWSVDNGAPATFTLNGIASQRTGAEFGQKLFATGLLSEGQHTLNVVYNGNSSTTPLSIYNVLVQNGASATVSGGAAGGGASATAPTGGNSAPSIAGGSATASTTPSLSSSSVLVIGTGSAAITVTVSANSSATGTVYTPGSSASGALPSPNPSSTAASSPGSTPGDDTANTEGGKHSHTGIIVGAIIGILVVLVLVLAVFFLRRKRKQQRARVADTQKIDTAIEPFTDPPLASYLQPPRMMTAPSIFSSTSASQRHLLDPVPQTYTDEKRQALESHAPTSSISTFSSPTTVEGLEHEIIIRHEDSGVRLPLVETGQAGARVVEMPPSYSADWYILSRS